MKLRFLMLDVAQAQKDAKKSNASELLDIHNELKLITAPDDVFDLWSEVISRAGAGELHDPDTDLPFKEKPNWNPESGNLTREFFKWLGNLTYEDLTKLARHILNHGNPKWTRGYPKVTIKAISSVQDRCYSTKEWVERRKRKHLVKKELHNINRDLGLFNPAGELVPEKWRQFKEDYHVTRATMNVLLERPGEVYFREAKQVRSKNKKTAEISPYAYEFFKVFLEKRKKFEKPAGNAHFRPYDPQLNEHADWPEGAWSTVTFVDMKLGVIDFRVLPGVGDKEKSSTDMPYFHEFMSSLKERREPEFDEVPAWLFICADMIEQNQAVHFAEHDDQLRRYKMEYADYHPARNERLGDYPANHKKARAKVHLVFLQRPDIPMVSIPPDFYAPETTVYTKPRAYDELLYRVYNAELRMEFYLWLMNAFCMPGSNVVSVYAGSKFTCAALVSSSAFGLMLFSSSRSDPT